jgi:hypothetical protein
MPLDVSQADRSESVKHVVKAEDKGEKQVGDVTPAS